MDIIELMSLTHARCGKGLGPVAVLSSISSVHRARILFLFANKQQNIDDMGHPVVNFVNAPNEYRTCTLDIYVYFYVYLSNMWLYEQDS